MLDISKTKGQLPRAEVFSEVHAYTTCIGVLLSRAKKKNLLDIKEIRAALTHAANAVFEHDLTRLRRRDPGKQGTYEDKIRFNDSISALRTAHAKMTNKINSWEAI